MARRRCGTRPAAGNPSPSGAYERGHPVAWSPDGKRLATGSGMDGQGWDAAGGRERLTLKGHTSLVRSVSWSPDGRGWRRGVRRDGEGVGRGQRPGTPHPQGAYERGHVRGLVAGRERLATGSADGTAKVWDAVGGREQLTLKGHTGWVISVSWSPDGTRLATGSADGTAKVWDAAGGREPLTLKGHTGSSGPWPGRRTGRGWRRGVRMGRQRCGMRPAAGNCSLSRGIRTGSFRCPGRRTGAAGDGEWTGRRRCGTRPAAGNCSPSRGIRAGSVPWPGRRMGRGWRRGVRTEAKVWDAAGGQELLTLKGHTGAVISVSWSPDGKRLATGSADGTAKVWDAAGGRELLTLRGIRARSMSVSWSPDGMRLATGSDGRHGQGVGRGRRPGTAHPQGAYGRGPFRVLVAGRDAAGDRGVGMGRRRCGTRPAPRRCRNGPARTAPCRTSWPATPSAVLTPRDSSRPGSCCCPCPSLRERRCAGAGPAAGPRRSAGAAAARGTGPVGGREFVWQEHRSPEAVVNFNAVLGRVEDQSVAYAVCYLESDRARDGLWLQVGGDDQAKVYLNGQQIYSAVVTRCLICWTRSVRWR